MTDTHARGTPRNGARAAAEPASVPELGLGRSRPAEAIVATAH